MYSKCLKTMNNKRFTYVKVARLNITVYFNSYTPLPLLIL